MSSGPSERLAALGERAERLAVAPDAISAPLVKLVRPILSWVGWQAKPEIAALRTLIRGLSAANAKSVDHEPALRLAIAELEANVAQVERATVVNRRVPTAYVAWLRRVYEVLVLAEAAALQSDATSLRIAGGIDPAAVLPPLAVRSAMDEAKKSLPEGVEARGPAAEEDEDEVSADDRARLIELELAAVDHLFDAARAEDQVLSRRRRLLEAARQLLLEVSAALPLDAGGVNDRLSAIAREITRIDRLQASGLSPDIGLLHQAKSALARGDRQKVYGALLAMDAAALERGDRAMARKTGEGLRVLGGSRGVDDATARSRSISLSAREIIGEAATAAIERGLERGREKVDALPRADHRELDLKTAYDGYFSRKADGAYKSAIVSVDGAFEVGGVLSPVRAVEHELRMAEVRVPTQDMVLVQARGVEDIPDAMIEDPRTILLSLASGRLLTRRYARPEPVPRVRTVFKSEVRIFVLDGSGSMIGPRARVRDSILIAELATLAERLSSRERTTRVALYYRYFNDQVGPVTRVDSPRTAIEAIEEVVASLHAGGTDIEGALVASFRLVREAQLSDPDLARAQIVLVTDGEATVSEARVLEARAPAGDLPIGVSVIALGQENPALRAIVARQRAAGERAFYHFIPDVRLGDLVSDRIDSGPPVHVPPDRRFSDALKTPAERAKALEEELGGLLIELSDLERERHAGAILHIGHRVESGREQDQREAERAKGEAAELTEEDEATLAGEGRRARAEALDRDQRAIERRFLAWFPDPDVLVREAKRGAGEGEAPSEKAKKSKKVAREERDDLDSVTVLLATIAEVVEVVGGSELMRKAEAIDLLEHMLPDARLSPARYRSTLARSCEQLTPAVRAVHEASRWGVVRKLRAAEATKPAPAKPV